MTTPAVRPERPERMTEEEFADAIGRNGRGWPDSLVAEARRSRAHEEDGWTLAEALAHEVGVQIEARLEAEREWGAAVRHHGDVMRELATTLGLAPDEKFDDGAARVVAERDAARKEAERLRGAILKTRGRLFAVSTEPASLNRARVDDCLAITEEALR